MSSGTRLKVSLDDLLNAREKGKEILCSDIRCNIAKLLCFSMHNFYILFVCLFVFRKMVGGWFSLDWAWANRGA